MDPEKWYKVVRDAYHLIKEDLADLEILVLVQVGELTDSTDPNGDKSKLEAWAELLLQTWGILTQILNNELELEAWNTISIRGRKNAITIFSIGTGSLPILLLLMHDITFDPMDILRTLLKHIFFQGYSDKYETVGLIASAGFPVWVSYPEGREMDDFLFAISITSLLSLVERIDMEVNAGGVANCVIQGDSHLVLNVAFNPTQDFALAFTQQDTKLEDIGLEEELSTLYQKIVDPVLFDAKVPEMKNEERTRFLEEIQQEFEGEITEEEIQTLNGFNTETLASLQKEIRTVTEKYRASEISIGYLRRRLKLPREVLSMSLEYLIANNQIKGRIGTKTGKQILVISQHAEINDTERSRIKSVQQQIKDLFLPLDPFLRILPTTVTRKPLVQETISEALSEFQVLITLSDTDPLFLQINDINISRNQLENSVKALRLLEQQISETQDDELLQSQLAIRKQSLLKNAEEVYLIVHRKAQVFYDDLLNSYRLILRLLPVPTFLKPSEDIEFVALIGICCHSHKCSEIFEILDAPAIWVKLGFFSQQLQLYDNPPDVDRSLNEVIAFTNSLTELFIKLKKLVSEEETAPVDDLPFLTDLTDLVIPNANRDSAINKLRQSSIPTEGEAVDFFSGFQQCKRCQRWYCITREHMANLSRCMYCA